MTFLAFLSGMGMGEWGIVLLVLVLFFGSEKIPELARSIGRAKAEFQKAARGSREGTPADPPDR